MLHRLSGFASKLSLLILASGAVSCGSTSWDKETRDDLSSVERKATPAGPEAVSIEFLQFVEYIQSDDSMQGDDLTPLELMHARELAALDDGTISIAEFEVMRRGWMILLESDVVEGAVEVLETPHLDEATEATRFEVNMDGSAVSLPDLGAELAQPSLELSDMSAVMSPGPWACDITRADPSLVFGRRPEYPRDWTVGIGKKELGDALSREWDTDQWFTWDGPMDEDVDWVRRWKINLGFSADSWEEGVLYQLWWRDPAEANDFLERLNSAVNSYNVDWDSICGVDPKFYGNRPSDSPGVLEYGLSTIVATSRHALGGVQAGILFSQAELSDSHRDELIETLRGCFEACLKSEARRITFNRETATMWPPRSTMGEGVIGSITERHELEQWYALAGEYSARADSGAEAAIASMLLYMSAQHDHRPSIVDLIPRLKSGAGFQKAEPELAAAWERRLAATESSEG